MGIGRVDQDERRHNFALKKKAVDAERVAWKWNHTVTEINGATHSSRTITRCWKYTFYRLKDRHVGFPTSRKEARKRKRKERESTREQNEKNEKRML